MKAHTCEEYVLMELDEAERKIDELNEKLDIAEEKNRILYGDLLYISSKCKKFLLELGGINEVDLSAEDKETLVDLLNGWSAINDPD